MVFEELSCVTDITMVCCSFLLFSIAFMSLFVKFREVEGEEVLVKFLFVIIFMPVSNHS